MEIPLVTCSISRLISRLLYHLTMQLSYFFWERNFSRIFLNFFLCKYFLVELNLKDYTRHTESVYLSHSNQWNDLDNVYLAMSLGNLIMINCLWDCQLHGQHEVLWEDLFCIATKLTIFSLKSARIRIFPCLYFPNSNWS